MRKPSFIKRLARATRYILGYYEGARWSSTRSWIPGGVQEAKLDITRSTRLELVRRSRYFEKNNALANKLGMVFEQYVVGADGLAVTPASSSTEFNEAAAEFWRDSQQYIDIEGGNGFGSMQGKIAWRWFFDGEAFLLKTRGESGFARIQLVEGPRIKTPEGREDDPRIVDGVEIDTRTGRPKAYWVDGVTRIDASLMIPVLERSRAMQCRSLPFLTPVLNSLHDLDDLTQLEMLNAKAHAEHAIFIENEAGEADVEDLLRDGASIVNGDSDSGRDTEARTAYYRDALGGRVVYGKRGDKINSIGNASPSAAQQFFWDYKLSEICAGVGISKLLVYPWSMQGTVSRADLDSQASYFRARSSIMAEAVRLVYRFIIDDAVRRGRLKGAPADFYRCDVRPPRGVNVDVGRNSSAMLAELKAGTRTFQSVYSELGLDWREELEQKAIEAEFVAQLAQDVGLPASAISDIAAEQPERTNGQET